MKKRNLINWLCLSGVISVVFYILHDVVGGMNYPGYNFMSQAVSDLTATDAPSFITASGYVTIYKILNCLCCALVCILIKKETKKIFRIGVYLFSIMNFISAIGYALFPLSSSGFDGSFQTIMHVYVITTIVVLLSIISLIFIAIGSFKSNKRFLGLLAIASLVLMFIGAVGSANVPKEIFGLIERFSTYSAVIFTGILGMYGFNIEK
ncbi:MAG: DUF998 domain-containing protein [Candidatus Saccharibacteria bacterium]|nr:DUF998 domain-containing protein [Candidatus Saccharibacteria bacterium]